MFDKIRIMNPFALVTGGSKGIGFEMARELAKRNFNIIIIARSEAELNAAGAKLKSEFGVEVYSLAVDLSDSNTPAKVLEFI